MRKVSGPVIISRYIPYSRAPVAAIWSSARHAACDDSQPEGMCHA